MHEFVHHSHDTVCMILCMRYALKVSHSLSMSVTVSTEMLTLARILPSPSPYVLNNIVQHQTVDHCSRLKAEAHCNMFLEDTYLSYTDYTEIKPFIALQAVPGPHSLSVDDNDAVQAAYTALSPDEKAALWESYHQAQSSPGVDVLSVNPSCLETCCSSFRK